MTYLMLMYALLSPPQAASGVESLISQIAKSGRVVEMNDDRNRVADPRRDIAPGAPPLLAFRYFEGAGRHRFGKLDLVLDDAGH